MAINFPSSPYDGEEYTDSKSGTWVYQSASNSWSLKAAGNTSPFDYRGGWDFASGTAPTGLKSGDLWTHEGADGATINGVYTGMSGTIAAGQMVLYDGSKYVKVGSTPGYPNTGDGEGATLDDRYLKLKGRTSQSVDGSIATTAHVTTGAIDIGKTDKAGCEIRADGLIRAQRKASSSSAAFQAWRGNKSSITLNSNGQGEFAGRVDVGDSTKDEYARINPTGDGIFVANTPIGNNSGFALVERPSGNEMVALRADGSVTGKGDASFGVAQGSDQTEIKEKRNYVITVTDGTYNWGVVGAGLSSSSSVGTKFTATKDDTATGVNRVATASAGEVTAYGKVKASGGDGEYTFDIARGLENLGGLYYTNGGSALKLKGVGKGSSSVEIDGTDGSITVAGTVLSDTAFQVNTYSDTAAGDTGSFLTGGILTLKNSDTAADALEVFRVIRGTTDTITFEADGSISAAGDASFGNAQGSDQRAIKTGIEYVITVTDTTYDWATVGAPSNLSPVGTKFTATRDDSTAGVNRVATAATGGSITAVGGATFGATITAGNELTTGTSIYASGSAQGIVSGSQKWYLGPDGSANFAGNSVSLTSNNTDFGTYATDGVSKNGVRLYYGASDGELSVSSKKTGNSEIAKFGANCQITASGRVFLGGAAPDIELNGNDGSATFAGDITCGLVDTTKDTGTGNRLGSTGGLILQRNTGYGPERGILSGYLGKEETVALKAGGVLVLKGKGGSDTVFSVLNKNDTLKTTIGFNANGSAVFEGQVKTQGGTVSPAVVLELEPENEANYEVSTETYTEIEYIEVPVVNKPGTETADIQDGVSTADLADEPQTQTVEREVEKTREIKTYVGPTMEVKETLLKLTAALTGLKTAAESASTCDELKAAINTALADI